MKVGALGMEAVLRRWPPSHPVDPDISRRTHPVRELRRMMLYVAQVHQLVFQFRHLVARESALRTLKIELVNRTVDHVVAEPPALYVELPLGCGPGLLESPA